MPHLAHLPHNTHLCQYVLSRAACRSRMPRASRRAGRISTGVMICKIKEDEKCREQTHDENWTVKMPEATCVLEDIIMTLCFYHSSVGVCDACTMQCFPFFNDSIFCSIIFNFEQCLKKHKKSLKRCILTTFLQIAVEWLNILFY